MLFRARRFSKKCIIADGTCATAKCGDQPIPEQFSSACKSKNSSNALMYSSDPSIEELAKGNYTMVVFVSILEEKEKNLHCYKPNIHLVADANPCHRDPKTRRPTHGVLRWCVNYGWLYTEYTYTNFV